MSEQEISSNIKYKEFVLMENKISIYKFLYCQMDMKDARLLTALIDHTNKWEDISEFQTENDKKNNYDFNDVPEIYMSQLEEATMMGIFDLIPLLEGVEMEEFIFIDSVSPEDFRLTNNIIDEDYKITYKINKQKLKQYHINYLQMRTREEKEQEGFKNDRK